MKMILDKDEVSVILNSLKKCGHEHLADVIQSFATELLPDDFCFDDFNNETPVLAIEHI